MVNELFVDSSNQAAFMRIYQSITGQKEDFEELVYQKKRFILRRSLASDWQRLTERLARLARKDRRGQDFTFQNLHHAVGELVACFPVYRSYIDSTEIRSDDLTYWETATRRAIERNPQAPADIFHFVRDMILQRSPDSFTPGDRARQLRLAGKFQQLTSPTAAKGVEDTAFYVYQRLISMNEVGGDPSRFGIDASELHQYFSDRQRHWPYALNVLSTHDTKRSEDVRARLNVLSELSEEWESSITRWMKLNAPHRQMIHDVPTPAADEEYLLYQTIVGAFPLAESGQEHETFVKRIREYMQKAIREAKLRTSWKYPDEQWEKAVDAFVAAILDESKNSEFLMDISAFSRRIAHYGLINSLSQTLLRLAVPGVPDTYQGMELWDFSLVDPDNRRPVDYGHRRRLIETFKAVDVLKGSQRCQKVWQMMDQKEDARAKLWVTRQTLHCRKKYPDLFTIGDYLPIEMNSTLSRHAFAFARQQAATQAIAVAPRFTAKLAPGRGLPIGSEIWGKTRLHLPDDFGGRVFENIFTGERIAPKMIDGVTQLLMSDVLANFPVALLISDGAIANH
jgi:(1->4)-alpha-D-glucan 1-alpha-D-glucosylmutase